MPEHDGQHSPPPPHGCRCGAHEITRACPVDCLRAVLSAGAFNLLARAWGAPFNPPGTAGEVADLYQQRRLSEIRGLGPRRAGEIGLSLRQAGLTGTESHGRQKQPRSQETTADV